MTMSSDIAQLTSGDLLDLVGTEDVGTDQTQTLERLRTLAFEGLAQGIADERMASLLRLLGWHDGFSSFAIAGIARFGYESAADSVKDAITDFGGHDWLIGSNRGCFVALVAVEGAVTPQVLCTAVDNAFDAKAPLCLTPARANVRGASRSIRAALSTMRVAPAIEPLPRPLYTQETLPERALMGDEDARDELYFGVYAALRSHGTDDPTLETVATFLNCGGSLESAAHELNVHPNTVRYRLKRAAQTTGWDATDPREAYVLRTAIIIGHIRDAREG